MTVLVCGYGSMGRRHAANIRAEGETVVVCELPGVDTADYSRVESVDMGLSIADAVVIATPAQAHAQILVAASIRRLPIYCEKPLALSLDDFSAAVVASNETWSWPDVTVGYNLRQHPGILAIRQMIDGEFIEAAVFRVSSDGRGWPGSAYADALLECSHEIDVALWLFGPAVCVSAVSSGSGRCWMLHLRHESGTVSSIHLDTICDTYVRGFQLINQNRSTYGWAWLDPVNGDGYSFGPHAERARRWATTADETYRAAMQRWLRSIREHVDDDGTGHASIHDGLSVLEICDEARRISKRTS